ncbi:39S ribosomal protein L33, mitochondrial, partial [Stegodyphus mimosarum]
MAKPKTSHVLVMLKSIVSHHKFPTIRPRNAEKLEVTKFDPHVQKFVLYKEMKKP